MPPPSTRLFNSADSARLIELCQQGHTVATLAKELGYTRVQVQNALSRLGLRAAPMRGLANPAHAFVPDAATIRARFKASGLHVKLVAAQLHVDCFKLNRELRGAKPLPLLLRKKLARLLELTATKTSSPDDPPRV